MRRILAMLAGCTVAVQLAGCGGENRDARKSVVPEMVLTYAENQSEDYPTTQGAYRFAELVKERTGGKIEIQIYPDSFLGDEKPIIEQLQFGGIDFVRASLGSLTDDIPVLNVLQMPYLYRDSNHMWSVLDGDIGKELWKAFDDTGLVPLSWYDAGARSFYTTDRPIEKLEDMQQMNIRVYESKMMEDMMRALGAVPVPMPYAEVYSALETGKIDGAENNWPSYESTGHYQVAGYYTLDEHIRVPEVQMISEATWKMLSSENQAILRECAGESAEYERELWIRRAEISEKKVREAGCVVTELAPGEKERFRVAVLPIYEKYCGGYEDIIEAITEEGK